jgi:hypothetical protein
VLFSRPDVANYINANFEAVWQSVRPVPLVHIDFGNGTKLTRTLHGNIATYCCAADGQVLDIVGGIYDPEGYRARLEQMRLLANYADQQGAEKRNDRLKEYHTGVVEALKKDETLPQFLNVAMLSKAKIEGGLKAVLVKGGRPAPKPAATAAKESDVKGEDVATFKFLLEDTKANEAVRRRQVSELLCASGTVGPEKITRKVYKDILLADLDDPYLGLGKTLFSTYPFAAEDGRAH